jgi:multiple sugar transport system substrate-binding protein
MEIRLRGLTWDDPRGRGPSGALADAFAQTEQGRDVTVQWEVQPLSGFESASVSKNAESYDVIIIDHPHVIEAATAGALAPIKLAADECYIGPSLESYRWKERLWAVPVDASSHVSAYREDRTDSTPATWRELFEMADGATRFGIPLRGVHALMALLTLLASMGTPLDAEAAELNHGTGLPVDADLVRAAQFLDRIASACVPESLGWNPLDALGSLVEGDCDCLPLTFGYAHFQNRGVRFAPIPTIDSARPPRPILGGTGMAVSARGAHVETAQALARFAGSADVQAELWPQHGGQPAHADAWHRLGETDSFYRDASSSLSNAYVRPRCAGWNQFQSSGGDAINHWLTERSGDAVHLVVQLRQLWSDATDNPETFIPTERG